MSNGANVFYIPMFICTGISLLMGQYFLAVLALIVGLLWLDEEDGYDHHDQ